MLPYPSMALVAGMRSAHPRTLVFRVPVILVFFTTPATPRIAQILMSVLPAPLLAMPKLLVKTRKGLSHVLVFKAGLEMGQCVSLVIIVQLLSPNLVLALRMRLANLSSLVSTVPVILVTVVTEKLVPMLMSANYNHLFAMFMLPVQTLWEVIDAHA